MLGKRSLRDRVELEIVGAMLPGNPLVTGTLTQGICNGISLYSNILLARITLSWFPQLFSQFPILRPLIIVTEPYLKVFRRTIPPIGGFDLSALPAFFILDILSQTTAVVGAEFPSGYKKGSKLKLKNSKTQF
jgi:YggT family protein